jgi:hypothetical protein
MNKVLCKDCKFAKISFINKLLQNEYGYRCKHPDSWYVPAPDNVLGLDKKGYFQSCISSRMYGEKCGPDAKNWVPKDTSKVFIFLQRI